MSLLITLILNYALYVNLCVGCCFRGAFVFCRERRAANARKNLIGVFLEMIWAASFKVGDCVCHTVVFIMQLPDFENSFGKLRYLMRYFLAITRYKMTFLCPMLLLFSKYSVEGLNSTCVKSWDEKAYPFPFYKMSNLT